MASKKTYKPIFSGLQFEFDESEVWDTSITTTNNEVATSETRRSTVPNPRHVKKAVRKGGSGVVDQVAAAAASLPVNIPDWKRILGEEYQDRRPRQDSDDNAAAAAAEEEEDEDGRLPPHEYLARTRVASLSVHEGVGRTLKGRDLWRVRNAILKQTGFED